MSEHQMGRPRGYIPRKTPGPPPTTGRRRRHLARAALEVLAAIGPRCQCGCGPLAHQHQTGGHHCGLHPDTCTHYQEASP